MLRNTYELQRHSLDARDGKIGHVTDIYFDDQEWVVRYFVVDTGKWLPGRQVLLTPDCIQPAWEARSLRVELTKDKIENSPPITADEPVSRQRERELADYYGWPVYTAAGLGWWTGAGPSSSVAAAHVTQQKSQLAELSDPDPHLRSAQSVKGYRVLATDDEIGHIEDFLLDDVAWQIPYLVIDTRNWLPGKKVAVGPTWVVGISWDEKTVRFDVPRQRIETAPLYDPTAPIGAEIQAQLNGHFKRPS